MFELRWVKFGQYRQLEYRYRGLIVDNWGDIRGLRGWSDWKVVETVDGNDAAYEDLIASGGLGATPE